MSDSDGTQAQKTMFSAEELAYFRGLIDDKRASAQDDIARMREQMADAREQAANDTAYSFHMADAGTAARERAQP